MLGLKLLPEPKWFPDESLRSILERRETRYGGGQVDLDHIGALMWFANRKLKSLEGSNDELQHRPIPSAGGLHPIELIVAGIRENPGVWWYRSDTHALALLDVADGTEGKLAVAASGCLPVEVATQIWLAGDIEKIRAKYERPESLLVREAGFILCGLTLVATALGLDAIPLGVTGHGLISEEIRWTRAVVGLGCLNIAKNIPNCLD
jgi:SagB-type dehydrogenase family enzyme